MKRMLKTFAVLIVVVIALFSFSIVASATEVSNMQNGLVASINSEKDIYKSGEDIELTFKVTNTNDFAVENVSLEAIIPEGLKLKSENDTKIDTVSLASGETLELVLTVVKESSAIVVPIETTSTENTTETFATEVVEIETVKPTSAKANFSTSNSNSKAINSSTVKTGIGMSYVLVALICIVCVVVIFISFRFKKKAVKYLSIVLCVCISLSSVVLIIAQNTWAQKTLAEESDTSTYFEVSKNVDVDGKDYTFVAIIKYQLSDLELYSNTDYVFTTEKDKYYVSFYCEPNNTFSKLELYCIDTDTVLCELQDNGNSKNGDTVADDGVYSAKIEMSSSKEKILSYQALMSVSSSKISSNIVEIEVIDDYPDEDYEKIETVDNAISELLESDEYKSLDFESKVKKVRSFLNSLASDSLIKFYSISYDEDLHIFGFQYFNGDLGGITIEENTQENVTDEPMWKPLDGKESKSSEVALTNKLTNNRNDCVIMYDWYESQPQIEECYREYEENWTEIGLNTTAYIHPTVNDYANNLTDKDVIIFATHGGQYSLYTAFLSKTTYSAICTLEKVSKEKNILYKEDINQHNVVKVDGEYWILPSFFSYHYENNGLEDSIVLMDNCYGFGGNKNLDDYTLSFELTDCGAQCVVGFHESVNIFWTNDINDDGVYDKIQKGYGPLFIENIVNNLVDGNTIGYSYDDSIDKFGNNCYEYMMRYNMSQYLEPEDLEEDKNVHPCIAGNSDFKLTIASIDSGTEEQPTSGDIEELGALIKEEASKNNEKITLKLWVPEDSLELTKKQVSEFKNLFKAYADIQIEVVAISKSDAVAMVINDKYSAADVFWCASESAHKLLRRGDLSKVDFSDEVISANTSESLSAVLNNSQLFAYPLTSSETYILCYNKSMISNSDITSLENIMSACKDSNKKFGIDASNAFANSMFLFTGGLEPLGFENDGYTQKFNDYDIDEITSSVYAFANLFKKYESYFESNSSENLVKQLGNGTVAAGFIGSWEITKVQTALGENAGFAILPTININGKDTPIKCFYGYDYLGVNNYSDFPVSSQILAYYLSNSNSQQERAKKLNFVPTNVNVIDSNYVKGNPALTSVINQSQNSISLKTISNLFWYPCEQEIGEYIADFDNDFSYNAIKLQVQNTITNILDK